jgi:hypothetical protein
MGGHGQCSGAGKIEYSDIKDVTTGGLIRLKFSNAPQLEHGVGGIIK